MLPGAPPPLPSYIKGIVLIFQSRVLSVRRVALCGLGRRGAPSAPFSPRAGRGGLCASGSGGAERRRRFRFRRHGAEHALVPLPPPRHRSVRREPVRGGARGGGGGRARREPRGGGAAEAVSFGRVRPGPRCRRESRERYRGGGAACGCPVPPSVPPRPRPAPLPPGGRSFGCRFPPARRPPPLPPLRVAPCPGLPVPPLLLDSRRRGEALRALHAALRSAPAQTRSAALKVSAARDPRR